MFEQFKEDIFTFFKINFILTLIFFVTSITINMVKGNIGSFDFLMSIIAYISILLGMVITKNIININSKQINIRYFIHAIGIAMNFYTIIISGFSLGRYVVKIIKTLF